MSNITRSRTFEITKECEYPSDYVVIDFETNGLEPRTCGIIQMAAVRYRNDVKVDTFTSFVYTTIIPPKVSELTSITLDDCKTDEQLKNYQCGNVVITKNPDGSVTDLSKKSEEIDKKYN